MPTAAAPRLEQICREHGLPSGTVAVLDALLEFVEAEPTSPTTVRDVRSGADVHIADSLSALELPSVRAATRIADIGAGAGFPGIALAAALPGATVALVESVGKKCEFMTRLAQVAGVANTRAVHARAEAWPEGLGRHDLVTARALAPLTALVEYAAPLLVEGGILCAWKGARDPIAEADGEAAAAATHMELVQVLGVRPWPEVETRNLHVYVKTGPTPERFPRRAGMARKRPITSTRPT